MKRVLVDIIEGEAALLCDDKPHMEGVGWLFELSTVMGASISRLIEAGAYNLTTEVNGFIVPAENRCDWERAVSHVAETLEDEELKRHVSVEMLTFAELDLIDEA